MLKLHWQSQIASFHNSSEDILIIFPLKTVSEEEKSMTYLCETLLKMSTVKILVEVWSGRRRCDKELLPDSSSRQANTSSWGSFVCGDQSRHVSSVPHISQSIWIIEVMHVWTVYISQMTHWINYDSIGIEEAIIFVVSIP